MNKKSLAETHLEIAKQWHPKNNGDLTPKDVTAGSGKKVWWKCPKGDDHEWEAYCNNRKKGSGCPICMGQKIVQSNCLATLNPKISKEWHPTKNGKLTPYDVPRGSSKKVWWKCPKGDDHEWKAVIYHRSKGIGCPVCSGNKIVRSNSLAIVNSELAKEWHPTKNGKLTPYDVLRSSNKKVWWKCPKGDNHEWEAFISNRSKGSGCLVCNNTKIVRSNSLAILNSELAKEWHPTKNGNLTPFDIGINSNKKVWWKCSMGDDHEWKISTSNRTSGTNCPICMSQKIVKSNCLATTHPELAKEWHPIKNGKITAYDVIQGSSKRIWWICLNDNNHEFKTRIMHRANGSGCPICTPGGFNDRIKGYLYINLVYHKSGKNIALKFGITNKYGYRIQELKRGLTLYKLKNIFYFEGDGKTVQNIESEILKKYDTGYITNEIMKYGFTETIKYSNKTLVEIYNLCNKKLKFKSGKKLYMKRLVNIFN